MRRRVRQHDIRRDALALDARAARAEELLDRDLEDAELDLATGRAIEIRDRLHGALAMRVGADDERATVVLQRAGEDLRGRRAEPVDHDDHRAVVDDALL